MKYDKIALGVKIAMVVLLFAYIFMLTSSSADNKKPLEKVADQVISTKIKEDTGIREEGAKELKRYYSLNAADIDGFVLYGPAGTMDVGEILIIKAKDESQMEDIRTSVQNRIDEQLKNFNGYGTNQTELLNHAVIRTNGRFLFFAVGDQAASLGQSFSKSVRK
ncbi:DUF4358 domain-containing protein [Hespellia stercorisuis]|uniref:DUF4358 domain-containing protein n=1 Tax=Hespellia stercorisuis DSM 15480 TaxID=1121950 RepID=A0A1M6N9C3_9FIRM|nr:DUF4358 domain-containing protein [Hespellia stercorisuis]SHJ92293.1 protein of unknown function [Hespellia stercorisuis DSM 15480]